MTDLIETLVTVRDFYQSVVVYLPYVLAAAPISVTIWAAFTSFNITKAFTHDHDD